MIDSVIFDMDGLLIDTEPYWQKTERELMAEYGININDEMQKATIGLRADEQINHWYKYQPWQGKTKEEIVEEFEERILNYFLVEAVLMPGALEIIEFFHKKGLSLALASSSSLKLIQTFVDKFRLNAYFRVIHSAENENKGKPDPAVYLSTLKKLNKAGNKCLAFEDSLHGVRAAKAAGISVVAVPESRHINDPEFKEADMVIRRLTEFGETEFIKLNNINPSKL